MQRLRLPAFYLFLLIVFSAPAQAFTAYAENTGFIPSYPQENLVLVKISAEGFLADRIYYAIVDKAGFIRSLTPAVDRYLHRMDCGNPGKCIVYDLWHIHPADQKIWDLMQDFPASTRRNVIPQSTDPYQEQHRQDWISFINGDTGGRFESIFLKDALSPPFGTQNIYGDQAAKQYVTHTLMRMMIAALLLIALFYAATRSLRLHRRCYSILAFIGYGACMICGLLVLSASLAVPPLYFSAVAVFTTVSLYRIRRPPAGMKPTP